MNFSLLHRWDDRPTLNGLRGAVLATQILIWILMPQIAGSILPRAAQRRQPRDHEMIHLVFYGNGASQPISHCKGLFRFDHRPDIDTLWLYDEECESHQTNVWLQPDPREPIYGYMMTDHQLWTAVWMCVGDFNLATALCEVQFIPESTS